MATIITKNSSTASSVPSAAQLVQGELAVNVADKRLFTENSGGTVVELGTNPSSLTLPNGTANGLAFLNASKVLTTGSALTFDGTNLGVGVASGTAPIDVASASSTVGIYVRGRSSDNTGSVYFTANGSTGTEYGYIQGRSTDLRIFTPNSNPLLFGISGSEQMRLTSTGLGIGTSSPGSYYAKNLVVGVADQGGITIASSPSAVETYLMFADGTSGADAYTGYIGYSHTSNFMRFATNGGGERMRLDSSGNLGLGVTPSAWYSTYRVLEGASASLYFRTDTVNDSGFMANAYRDASAVYRFKQNGAASYYAQGSGQHQFYTSSSSGTAGNAISFTQAMTLDASGNLGIGVTPSYKLDVGGIINASSAVYWGAGTGKLQFGGGDAYIDSTGALILRTGGANERARIDSSGNLLVGKTTTAATSIGGVVYLGKLDVARDNGDAVAFKHATAGNTVGSISITSTATTYNTSSDYRLKEAVQPMTGALAKVAKLKPVTYKWKADGSDGEGFIAHELQEVCPSAVTGEKDAVDAEGNPQYQGIDTSFLAGLYAAAIQELKAELDAAKARIAALEAPSNV